MGRQLGVGDVARLFAVGGSAWWARNVGAERSLEGIVHSAWWTYAYRTHVRAFLTSDRRLSWLRAPPAPEPQVAPPRRLDQAFEWTRADYGPPNENWRALDLIFRLCDRHAPGRCLIFSGPINPDGRASLAEPGLQEEYVGRLRELAGSHRVTFLDLSDTMVGSDFVRPDYATYERIHLNADGRQRLAGLLVEPLLALIRARWGTASPVS